MLAVPDGAETAYCLEDICIRSDGQNSLGLCLCALLGLGVCRSAPWVKKLSLTVIPEWYHDGGPRQIGHSLAVTPDCLCSSSACFVQPQSPAEDTAPKAMDLLAA